MDEGAIEAAILDLIAQAQGGKKGGKINTGAFTIEPAALLQQLHSTTSQSQSQNPSADNGLGPRTAGAPADLLPDFAGDVG